MRDKVHVVKRMQKTGIRKNTIFFNCHDFSKFYQNGKFSENDNTFNKQILHCELTKLKIDYLHVMSIFNQSPC